MYTVELNPMGSVQEHHYAQNLCYMAKPSPDHKTLDDYAGHFLLYGLHHLHHQHRHQGNNAPHLIIGALILLQMCITLF